MAVAGNMLDRKVKWHRARGGPLLPRLFPEVSSENGGCPFLATIKKPGSATSASRFIFKTRRKLLKGTE
jgi:hypothetical protein